MNDFCSREYATRLRAAARPFPTCPFVRDGRVGKSVSIHFFATGFRRAFVVHDLFPPLRLLYRFLLFFQLVCIVSYSFLTASPHL